MAVGGPTCQYDLNCTCNKIDVFNLYRDMKVPTEKGLTMAYQKYTWQTRNGLALKSLKNYHYPCRQQPAVAAIDYAVFICGSNNMYNYDDMDGWDTDL